MTTFDFQTYKKIAEENKAKPSGQVNQMFRQAAVSAELLTSDPHWDYFLSIIQEDINQTEELVKSLQEQLTSATIVNHDDIIKLKIGIAQFEARISVLRQMQEVPKTIIEQAKPYDG